LVGKRASNAGAGPSAAAFPTSIYVANAGNVAAAVAAAVTSMPDARRTSSVPSYDFDMEEEVEEDIVPINPLLTSENTFSAPKCIQIATELGWNLELPNPTANWQLDGTNDLRYYFTDVSITDNTYGSFSIIYRNEKTSTPSDGPHFQHAMPTIYASTAYIALTARVFIQLSQASILDVVGDDQDRFCGVLKSLQGKSRISPHHESVLLLSKLSAHFSAENLSFLQIESKKAIRAVFLQPGLAGRFKVLCNETMANEFKAVFGCRECRIRHLAFLVGSGSPIPNLYIPQPQPIYTTT
jgi:hypothetical protein